MLEIMVLMMIMMIFIIIIVDAFIDKQVNRLNGQKHTEARMHIQ